MTVRDISWFAIGGALENMLVNHGLYTTQSDLGAVLTCALVVGTIWIMLIRLPHTNAESH